MISNILASIDLRVLLGFCCLEFIIGWVKWVEHPLPRDVLPRPRGECVSGRHEAMWIGRR